MQENKFENQVQKIMDQLSFDPGDAVWTKVSKEVGKEKKRRRPFFWLVFIAVPIVFGTGYFFISNNHFGKTSAFNPLIFTDSVQLKQSGSETVPDKGLNEGQNVKKSGQVLNYPIGTISNDKTPKHDYIEKNDAIPETNKEIATLNSEKTESANARSETIYSKDTHSAGKIKKPASYDSSSQTKPANNQNKKTAKWKIGFSGIIGMSETNEGPVNQANVNFPAFAPGPANTVVNYLPVNKGFSFSVGGFVSRILSRRISISAGLNYKYYSTKINIGDLSNNSLTYFGPSMQSYATGVSANTASHSYTNQYHFLELPVSIDFMVNKSKKLPIIWEAGFSFAYLLNTNALYFYPSTEAYYKNIQFFNRTQWNATSALMIGFDMHHGQMLLGPQVQYGLSDILKSSTINPQHFLSYGLKISIIP